MPSLQVPGCGERSDIRIRPAQSRDLGRIAEVCLKSLPDDPTFDYLWRYRAKYPQDNFSCWQQKLKAHLFNRRYTLLVAVLGDDTIIAMALWERNGGSLAARKRRIQGPHDMLRDGLTRIENWAISRRQQRRDVDPLRFTEFLRVMGSVHERYWEKDYAENFHLELLCTHPDFRRRGAGTLLIRWGIELGRKEDASVGVESSPGGLSLYKKLGFKQIALLTVRVQGDDAELSVPVLVIKNARSV
ncbi:acyl-CoA N-acyltransferase [Sphaerosporella brunnea]|uniref:Acyl-CoA N-acyltransferase n=1 Tax=Sphaerosporella brunnea TaxID=1250544 RepID=A0A5J5EVR1_9PEZI|nr:acyl-CoA N-acyltransferase [Sphaerosporella brunnea]